MTVNSRPMHKLYAVKRMFLIKNRKIRKFKNGRKIDSLLIFMIKKGDQEFS